jgi:sulfite reductase (NADPH) hemoprotein beta-component
MDQEAPRTAADLLAFADVGDIDEFIDGLGKYERGEWTADQFRVFRLARGTYGQRQADVNMIRVKIPLGIADVAQLEALADVAERFSRGFGHVTTRQNVQFHFVKLAEAADAQRVLADSGLTTREACGNTVRNVTGCAMAGACTGESFDVTAYGQAIARHFLRRKENQSLPRKFKIALSGCADDCAAGAINDVALIARVHNGVRGFRVKIAGGLSTTPEDAHLLFDFLPADEVIPTIEAVVAVFDKHGNRQNRSRARLKYVVRKLGWEATRAAVMKELEGRGKITIDPSGNETLSRTPSLPIARDGGGDTGQPEDPAFTKWRATNCVAQRQHGFVAVTVRLVRGDITAAQLRGVARLAQQFGDGMARFTIDQNLLLRFVSESRLRELHAGLAAIGLAEADAHSIVDVTSCPGADSCNLAVTASRELASALTARLTNANGATSAVAAAKDLDIKISGCPNSCGQHHIAGIGFHGGMRRVGGKIVPEYTLHLGGGIDAQGATFGRTVIKLPARRVPEALLRLLHLYEDQRQPGEKARDFFRRVPDDVVKGAVAELMKIDEASAKPEDYLDLGDGKEFVVATGPGECAV